MDVMIYYTGWNGKRGSHDLLMAAAADWLREEGRAAETENLSLKDPGTYKKPFFLHPEKIKFSISHSGSCWMCAFGQEELGLDVQGRQRCTPERLAERFFHPLEREWLEQTDYHDFYHVWSAKESYLKYTAQGLTEGMDFFSVADEKGLTGLAEDAVQRHFRIEEKTAEGRENILAVCVTARQISTVRWKMLSAPVEGTFEIKITAEEK